MKRSHPTFVVATLVALAASVHAEDRAAAAEMVRDERTFSFGSGIPFGGIVETACGRVTLITTNTERFETTSFRDNLSGGEAEVKFAFERAPLQLSLVVSRVRSDEYIAKLSVPAASLDGTLVRNGERITTSRAFPADDGYGTVTWLSPGATTLRFVLGGPDQTALAVDSFTIVCAKR